MLPHPVHGGGGPLCWERRLPVRGDAFCRKILKNLTSGLSAFNDAEDSSLVLAAGGERKNDSLTAFSRDIIDGYE